jgi:hypothetical protein
MGTESLPAILVPSFDCYSDIWAITAFSFERYWPDCPYPIYLGANGGNRSLAVPRNWRYINRGPDLSWSRSMADYLAAVPADRVLVYLDDFILTGRPDADAIAAAVDLMTEKNIPFIQLLPKPECQRQYDNLYAVVPSWNDYRTSLMPTLWEKALLAELLRYDFNPWQFERRAGLAPEARRRLFLAVRKEVLPFHHCVQKGKVLPWVDSFLISLGYEKPVAEGRERMSNEEVEESRNRLSPWRRALLRLPRALHILKLIRAALQPVRKAW